MSSSPSTPSSSYSSWSSRSPDSSASSNSSSSSWSSETSGWDTGRQQAKSYLINWDIQVRHNIFYARCAIDLRWRDAVIVQARGPLLADVGGAFGTDFYPREVLPWIDGFSVIKHWSTPANAEAWAAAVEARLQASMAVLRLLYTQYPNKFDQRTRTI